MLAQSNVLVAGAHQPGRHGNHKMTNAKAFAAFSANKAKIDTMLTHIATANRLARDSTAIAIALGAIAACDQTITLVEV